MPRRGTVHTAEHSEAHDLDPFFLHAGNWFKGSEGNMRSNVEGAESAGATLRGRSVEEALDAEHAGACATGT